ncbi:hypothetical protein SCHPADRAFT_992778 [Schizopora paradoxa]|uniref:F-box domain-containing protein n=1 Tax=Schizopora paradoxa TaxID=27342 RepID=A0A0H2S6H3_9AGAM|nr:hypothetical protein SCHPADRAFT_992778 [Schizopora paradoxa]
MSEPPGRLLRLVTGPNSRAVGVRKRRFYGRRKPLGMLEKLLSIPLDIFFNILKYLGPVDLLSLARSCGALHEVLVTRQMKGVWKACLDAHNVPPLPDNIPINEVQLAAMLFENSCQACGAQALKNHFHDTLLVRLCLGCLEYK